MDGLSPELVKAFERLLKGGVSADKGCAASTAIARALFALDYDGAELYLAGMHHVQIEPAYIRPTDTAVDLRSICAMGLVSTNYRHKLRELVDLLVDPEWQARAGAVRAIATAGSEPAALLLRLKAQIGDKEPDVMADCFSGLLTMEGVEALPLVTSFADGRAADGRAKELSETAILALGESRRAEAVEWLKEKFARTADGETRQAILLALATSRTEPAIEFVLGLIRSGSEKTSEMALSAMEVNRGDRRLQEEVEKALQERRA